jgi:predicted MFS family arabinose efflux permease
VFSLAVAGFAAILLIQVLLPLPRILMIGAFFSGAFSTVHAVAMAPFFMRNAEASHRTELFGIASAVNTVAAVCSALGAGALARFLASRLDGDAQGLKWALVVAALASAAAVVPFSRIRSVPFGSESRRLRDYVYADDMRVVFKLALPSCLVGCGAGLTVPFLNLYFRDRFHQGPAAIGFYFGVAQIVTALGFLAGPLLARRFSHVRAVVMTELLSIPFFLILAVSDRLWLAVVAFWMRGALMNMNAPVSAAFGMEIVRPDQQVVTNSLRMFSWNLSWSITTALGGWLIERHGYAPGMFLTIGFYLAAAGLFWSFFRERRV